MINKEINYYLTLGCDVLAFLCKNCDLNNSIEEYRKITFNNV